MKQILVMLAAIGVLGTGRPAKANPIFPYFYEKFPQHEQKVRELGYTPTPHLLGKLNSSAAEPYNLQLTAGWIRAMKHIGPGFVYVTIDDAQNEATVVRVVRELADMAKKDGFTVVLYPYFGTSVPTAEAALPWVEKIGRDNVGLTLHMPQEIKSGNARRFPEIIAKVKGHIKLVVICGADLPKEGEDPGRWSWERMMRPLGEGDFDVGAFVRSVKATGYTGYFGQICWGIKGDAAEYLAKSFTVWKLCAGEM